MLHTMKRGLLVGGVVAVVAALLGGSALAARGHGHAKFGVRGGGFVFGGTGDQFGGGPGRAFFGGPGMGVFGGPGMGGGFGFAFGGPGMRGPAGPGMHGGPGGGLLAGDLLKNAAAFLQIPLADLQADLKGGKTLAQEAVAKNKTAAALITALTTGAKNNLDAAVAAGWITQKQADAALEGITKEITALVNNGPPVLPEGKVGGPLDAAASYLGVTPADL